MKKQNAKAQRRKGAKIDTEKQPILIIACAIFRGVLPALLEDRTASIIHMDYGLHVTPQKMRAAIQAHLDTLDKPHRVLIGYGLCGNGLVGLQSRQHTLVIPRVDDCIALFLGSRAAYLSAFRDNPATYYLTPGWIESGGEPLSAYQECCAKYGPDKAAWVADAMYRHYRNLCLLVLTPEELETYRSRASQIADFCRERWGWQYEERIGSDALIRRLTGKGVGRIETLASDDEFVVVEPDQEVRQESFMRSETILQEESGPCTTYTIK
jgi:hypothetical protein